MPNLVVATYLDDAATALEPGRAFWDFERVLRGSMSIVNRGRSGAGVMCGTASCRPCDGVNFRAENRTARKQQRTTAPMCEVGANAGDDCASARRRHGLWCGTPHGAGLCFDNGTTCTRVSERSGRRVGGRDVAGAAAFRSLNVCPFSLEASPRRVPVSASREWS